MPTEQRSLVFSNEEFLAAVMSYNKKRGGEGYMLTDVRQVGFDETAGGTAVLTMSDGEVLRFSEADLISALISHCIDRGIPLPVRSSKKLRSTDDGMVLSVAEWERRLRPSPQPQTMTA